jgi:hypothetical protein
MEIPAINIREQQGELYGMSSCSMTHITAAIGFHMPVFISAASRQC